MAVSFKEALKLIDIKSQNTQLLSLHSFGKDKRCTDQIFTLKELTDKLDLSKIFVYKIDYSCHYDGEFICWDFWVIDNKGKHIDLIDLYWKVHGRS